MPLWYTTTSEEHLAVRNSCGIFDVSHMGRFTVDGPKAAEFLEGLVPTQVQQQPAGKAFYTLLLNEKGGIIDDLIISRRSEFSFLVVVNAANAEEDMRHIMQHVPSGGPQVNDVTGSSAMIAVQGPRASEVLQPLTSLDLGQLKRFRCADTDVLKHPATISRTGYTGEDGFEVIIHGVTNADPEVGLSAWSRLASASTPCGLSARDSLRLEAGFPLHGFDIDPQTNPFQADLAWVVSAEKKGYVGYDEIARLRASPPDVVKRGAVLDRGIPRHGFEVLDTSSNHIGRVTSGTFSPILRRGIALCRVKNSNAELGRPIIVDVRGSSVEARLVKPPFYDEKSYGWKRGHNGK